MHQREADIAPTSARRLVRDIDIYSLQYAMQKLHRGCATHLPVLWHTGNTREQRYIEDYAAAGKLDKHPAGGKFKPAPYFEFQ